MSKYRPGTLDDFAVVSRRQRKAKRLANEANLPSGSQVNNTTEKVEAWEGWKADADAAIAEAEQAATNAKNAVDQLVIPNEVRFTSSPDPPSGFKRSFSWDSPGGTIYAYEREES